MNITTNLHPKILFSTYDNAVIYLMRQIVYDTLNTSLENVKNTMTQQKEFYDTVEFSWASL